MMRWQTYINLMPQTNLKENGILSPSDLIRFPWDDETGEILSDEDAQDLANLIVEANKKGSSQ